MNKSIIIIDCGGNLRSVEKKISSLGFDAIITNKANHIERADKLILPGVGHFSNAMNQFKKYKILDILNKKVLIEKTPILGICLGMQLMAKYSEEGGVEGLGWIEAKILKFKIKDKLRYKVPHMGWNNINVIKKSKLFEGLSDEAVFYFVHSYHIECYEKNDVLSSTKYEYEFTSSLQKENIYGTQFHPEKSHRWGEKILNNFIDL
tara:strand:+ start:14 stop:631 length:618 start_codon:yes stop_codon:yes gene_type:complete